MGNCLLSLKLGLPFEDLFGFLSVFFKSNYKKKARKSRLAVNILHILLCY